LCALFFGAGLCAAAWLASGWWADAWLQRAGVALLVLSVPLLALGAHCFDCVDNETNARYRSSTGKGEWLG
jgi:hypothetical protein